MDSLNIPSSLILNSNSTLVLLNSSDLKLESDTKPLIGTCFLCGIQGCVTKLMLECSISVKLFSLCNPNFCKQNTYCSSCKTFLCRINDLNTKSLSTKDELNTVVANVASILFLRDCENSNQSQQQCGYRTSTCNNSVSKLIADGLLDTENVLKLNVSKETFFRDEETISVKKEYKLGNSSNESFGSEGPCVKMDQIDIANFMKTESQEFVNKNRHKVDSFRMRRHYTKDFPKQKTCYFCLRTLSTKQNLERHLLLFHIKEVKFYKCQLCEKRYPQKSNLQLHFTMVHGTKEEKENILSRRRRIRKQNKMQPAKCYFCNVFLVNYYDLLRHMRYVHTKELHPQKCLICNKTYADRRYLRIHQLKCHNISDKMRLKKQKLYKKKVEKNKVNVNCYFCQKHLTRKDGLELHMRTYTKEGAVGQCKKCQRVFYARKLFAKHSLLACRTTKDDSKLEKYLKRRDLEYAKTKEKQKGFCNNCGKCFLSLKRHIKTCGVKLEEKKVCLSFETVQNKLLHDAKEHGKQKPLSCYFCFKQFVHRHPLEKHMYCHNKEKIFLCKIPGCRKRFAGRCGVVMHMTCTHGADKNGRKYGSSSEEMKNIYSCYRQKVKARQVVKCCKCTRKFVKEKSRDQHQDLCDK